MSKLEFVGTKIPSEWVQKLKQLTEETGKTQSAIVRDAIAAAIGVNRETEVNPLREELDDLKTRVQALEQLTRLSKVNQAKPIASGVVPDELARFGVICDFELKKISNPLSRKVRWLFLD